MNEPNTKPPLGTDWKRVDNLTDDQIDTSDSPPLSQACFKRARIRMPKRSITMQIDADVVEWFQAQGDDFERRMNAALRLYAESHKAA